MKYLIGMFSVLLLLLSPVDISAQYHFNQAGAFSGGSYIAVKHSPSLAPTSGITIEAWIYPTAYPSDAIIVEKNYRTSYSLHLRHRIPTAVLQFGFDSTHYVTGGTKIPANTWTHIAATYDSATGFARLYVNGSIDTISQTYNGGIPTNSDSLYIGAGIGGGSVGNYFTGYIDELRIWNVSRPGGDINETKHMPLAVWRPTSGPYAGLVSAYRMNGNALDEAGQTYEDGKERNMSYLDLSQKALNHLDYNNNLVLDGTGYCIAPRSGSTDATTAITVEAWVKRDTTHGADFQAIAGKTSGSAIDYLLYIHKPSHRVFFNINTNALSVASPAGGFRHTRWTHIAATYNSVTGAMILYINGDSVGAKSTALGSTITTSADSIAIGNATGSRSDFWFAGQIDEVRVWTNKVRTEEEIRQSMFRGVTWNSTPRPTGATVWSFDGQNFDAVRNPGSVPWQEMHFRGGAYMTSAHWYSDDEPVSPLIRDDAGGFYGVSYVVSRRQWEIPDASGGLILDSVFVPAAGGLSGVRAFVLVNHEISSDLRITLVHPGGTAVPLFIRRGYDENDIVCVFSDDADSVAGTTDHTIGLHAPFSPLVKPHDPLSAFTGLNAHGWWKLQVEDVASGRTGVLYGWGVQTPLGTGVSDQGTLPEMFALDQNFPNPFNPSTTIRYELPRTAYVTLSVFDMLGREVSVLVNDGMDAGHHEVQFDASRLSTGVYFYRLRAENFVSTKKMLILR
jgi:subtilisin-like proprotein convertase family protein